jgi:hypothetical protein
VGSAERWIRPGITVRCLVTPQRRELPW